MDLTKNCFELILQTCLDHSAKVQDMFNTTANAMSLLAQAVVLADSKDVDRRMFEIMLAILKNSLRSLERPTSMGKWMIFVDEFKTKGDIQRFQTGVITFATLVHGLTQVQAIRVFKEHDGQEFLVELIKACVSHSLDAPMETFINTFLEAPEDEMFSYKREFFCVGRN